MRDRKVQRGCLDSTLNKTSRISGVVITELRQINDARGSVLHMLRANTTEFKGFGECYFSEIFPGVVKAWKRHHEQTQNLAVPIGRIRLVIYDDRVNSTSLGVVQEFELGRPDSYVRVKIPPLLWYGFTCIGPTLALVANCADRPHDPQDADSREMTDPSIPYYFR